MKVGSLVVLKSNDNAEWRDTITGKTMTCVPSPKEICCIASFYRGDDEYIVLEEYPIADDGSINGLYRDYFRELQPPMDLTELLEETITELA
jgi:hypothetical protein